MTSDSTQTVVLGKQKLFLLLHLNTLYVCNIIQHPFYFAHNLYIGNLVRMWLGGLSQIHVLSSRTDSKTLK